MSRQGWFRSFGALVALAACGGEAPLSSQAVDARRDGAGADAGDGDPGDEGGGTLAIGAREAVTRLARFLWASPPDQRLLDLAAAGQVRTPDDVAAQARSMMDDPRWAAQIRAFYSWWLEVPRIRELEKADPAFSRLVAEAMADELLAFASQETLEPDGRYTDLMRAPTARRQGPLAPIYADDPDDRQRSGLLTLPGLLARGSRADRSSPSRRGVQVLEKFYCWPVPAPPAAHDTQLPDSTRPLRQRLEQVTAQPACISCHNLIDQVGFGFETYDPIGRHRPREADGTAVNAVGKINGKDFLDGVNLAALLATDEQAHACYVEQWLAFALGRPLEARDREAIPAVVARFAGSGTNIRALLLALVASPAFLAPGNEGAVDAAAPQPVLDAAEPPPSRDAPVIPISDASTAVPETGPGSGATLVSSAVVFAGFVGARPVAPNRFAALTPAPLGPRACTQGPGDLWCALWSVEPAAPGLNMPPPASLWAVNLTAASRKSTAVCPAERGDECRRVMTDIPYLGAAFDPLGAQGFVGNTLLLYAGPSPLPPISYVGPAWAWRPGWRAPQALAALAHTECRLSASGAYAACPVSPSMASDRVVVAAGAVAEGGAMLQSQDCPHGCNHARFSPDEKYLVWRRADAFGGPSRHVFKPAGALADATAAATPLAGDGDHGALAFTADGAQVLYLAGRTLLLNAFPPAAAPRALAAEVRHFGVLADGAGAARGAVWLADVGASGAGTLTILRDLARPETRQTLPGVCALSEVSANLERVVYSTECESGPGIPPGGPLPDGAWRGLSAQPLDPTTGAPAGKPCVVASAAFATTQGRPSLTADGRWLYWVERTSMGEAARLTDLARCETTRIGATPYGWMVLPSRGYLDLVATPPDQFNTLRLLDISSGAAVTTSLFTLGAPNRYALAGAPASLVFVGGAGNQLGLLPGL